MKAANTVLIRCCLVDYSHRRALNNSIYFASLCPCGFFQPTTTLDSHARGSTGLCAPTWLKHYPQYCLPDERAVFLIFKLLVFCLSVGRIISLSHTLTIMIGTIQQNSSVICLSCLLVIFRGHRDGIFGTLVLTCRLQCSTHQLPPAPLPSYTHLRLRARVA